MQKRVPTDFNDYVRHFPERSQTALRKLRAAVKKAAPQAKERISYNLPSFSLNGKMLVWFGAYTSHIGFYPGAAAIVAFADELSPYETAKGSVQFPLDRALPLRLIERIVKFKARESKEGGTR